MVGDHSKANEELASLAKSKGLNPPAAPDGEHQKVLDKFSALKGRAFDVEYWKQMLDDHKKTIVLFEKESSQERTRTLRPSPRRRCRRSRSICKWCKTV